MGILFADFDKKRRAIIAAGGQPEDDMKQRAEQTAKRMMILLGEAENAYAVTWEQLREKMKAEGFGDWAAALEVDEQQKQAIIASLHSLYDQVQEAIKKEASLMKKQAENMWNNILMPDGKTTIKDAFEQTISSLGIQEGRVSRANSLIGAGQTSERVADKLAIKQMQVQLAMQQHYYNLIKKQGQQRIDDLDAQIKREHELGNIEKEKQLRLDRQHLAMSLNIALTKEQTDILKQQESIIAKTEESEARLYKELRDWADLLTSSLQSVFEASNTGNAEYYNERAKLQLTGETKGSQQYIIIDNAGTSDATAHYETLSELEALERQHEIEQENARAEAWKKVMDDVNAKISDMITDQVNAMLQNSAVDANTDALGENTRAILAMTEQMAGQAANTGGSGVNVDTSWASSQGLQTGYGSGGNDKTPVIDVEPARFQGFEGDAGQVMPLPVENGENEAFERYQQWVDTYNQGQDDMAKKTDEVNKKMTVSSQSMYSKMTQAMNLYGIAYQAMSNDNLTTEQKFEMIAVQAAGNAAISALTASLSSSLGQTTANMPAIASKCFKMNPIAGAAIFAAITAVLGGLMGVAVSKIAKSKSEISAATGASNNSVASGRLTTGMLTYAEGNVNEFTDPASLTPGKSYNVDAADGKTYRAKYTGSNPRTHLTSGPEFHLAGEKGREMIIDAGTTRQITMNEREIFHAIQTLSGGGRLRRSSARRGVGAFAEGNVDDFADSQEFSGSGGMDMTAMLASLDRNSAIQEALLERLSQPIQAKFDVYGKGGLVDSYDTGKKTVNRYGQRY